MKFKKGLIRAPFLRSDEPLTKERHATWQETFFDLAFVAVIGQMSSQLVKDFSWHGLGVTLLLFVPMWWIWVGQVFYLSRFDSEDLIQKMVTLVQIVFVAAMGVAVPRVAAGNHVPFVICYTSLRMILIFQYQIVGRNVPKAGTMVKIYTRGFTIAAAIWFASVFVPMPYAWFFWLVGITIDFWTPFLCPNLAVELPPDPGHVPERFGLFTIIVLGEALIATVSAVAGQKLAFHQAAVGISGLLLAFSIWWIYFEAVGGADPREIRNLSDVRRNIPWMYAHLPMQACVVVLAVGIKQAMSLGVSDYFTGDAGLIFSLSVFGVNGMMHIIYLSRLSIAERRAARQFALPHTIVTLISGFLIPASFVLPADALVGIAVILGISHIVLALRELPVIEASRVPQFIGDFEE